MMINFTMGGGNDDGNICCEKGEMGILRNFDGISMMKGRKRIYI